MKRSFWLLGGSVSAGVGLEVWVMSITLAMQRAGGAVLERELETAPYHAMSIAVEVFKAMEASQAHATDKEASMPALSAL
jgi:hypothetical protein